MENIYFFLEKSFIVIKVFMPKIEKFSKRDLSKIDKSIRSTFVIIL